MLVKGVDIIRLDIHLGKKLVVDKAVQAQLVIVAQSQFAQVKCHHIGEAHLVGKIEFDQLVIYLEHIAPRAKCDDAASLVLDAPVDDTSHIECRLSGALIGALHDLGIYFLISRERRELDFILRAVIPARYLIELGVGL